MKGFTLVELIVTVAVLGVLALAVGASLMPNQEARLIACLDGMDAMHTLVVQTEEQSWPFTPTFEQICQLAGTRWDDHYHYVPNAEDTNNGHGNDLDICDAGNPGASSENRNCLEIKWLIVCDHNHGSLARYVGLLDGYPIYAFGDAPEDAVLMNDVLRWPYNDPNLRRWIGR